MEEIRDFLANTIELKKLLQMYPLLRSEAGTDDFNPRTRMGCDNFA